MDGAVIPPAPDLRAPDAWLPEEVAAALVAHGEVAAARGYAERGDWHCARAVAETLTGQGLAAQAADRSPWENSDLAILLIRRGRAADAVALFHTGTAARQAAKRDEDTAFWRAFSSGR